MPPVDINRLKNRRDELDLSNQDVADRADTPEPYIRNIMCGVDDPGMRVIHRLSRALDLPVKEIIKVPEGGKRTPTGDPSDPPKQPDKGPTGPKRRGNGTGPRRDRNGVAA